MFGDNDNEDDQRWWNFMIFNFYGTDKELEESSPALVIVAILVIIGLVIWYNVK